MTIFPAYTQRQSTQQWLQSFDFLLRGTFVTENHIIFAEMDVHKNDDQASMQSEMDIQFIW